MNVKAFIMGYYSSILPFVLLHNYKNPQSEEYRKDTIPLPAQNIRMKNLRLSPRNLHRRSKTLPFYPLSMLLAVIKYQ
jgi:hypothetical protein